MVNQVIYQTDYGNMLAAKAEESYLPGQGSHRSDISDVQVVHTSGELEFLLGAVAGATPGQEWNVTQLELFNQVLFESVQQSRQRDISSLMQEAFQAANQSIRANPSRTELGWTAIMAAIQENRLYLAQVGASRAYLIRENHLLLLTRDQTGSSDAVFVGDTVPIDVSGRNDKNRRFNFIGKDRMIRVDTAIHLPNGDDQAYLELQPGDGVILCQDGLVDNVLLRGQDHHLREDFISLYSDHTPAVIADRMIQAADRTTAENTRSIVVIKMDEKAFPAAPVPFSRGILSQVGLIALILTVSISLGLGAAYAIPAVMNPKPVPNTGANSAVPSGFVSILMADGLVQATVPGQPAFNLAPGAVVDAKPGTIFETTRGTLKFSMVDGTNVYVDNNTKAVMNKLADPKAGILETDVTLQKGGLIVDSTHANDTQVYIAGGGPVNASATGSFFGVQYSPNNNQLAVDCLEGPCRVTGANASRDLQTGQAASVVNGVVGVANPADWARWASLCDTDCPIQSPNALPTPTISPTPLLAPYLSDSSGQPDKSLNASNFTGMKSAASFQSSVGAAVSNRSNIVLQSTATTASLPNPTMGIAFVAPTPVPTLPNPAPTPVPTLPNPGPTTVPTVSAPAPTPNPTAAAPATAPTAPPSNPGNPGGGNGNGHGNGNGNGKGHKKGGG
jgi:serine/threonine protein phosphatase PrpC